MATKQTSSLGTGPNARQRSARERASKLNLHNAVRMAVHSFFRFTHRAKEGKSLWCQRERVWLGNRTFLDWSMSDADMNIPWVVSVASDAPETTDELHDTVRSELKALWDEQLKALPSKSTPTWPPLP